MFGIENFVCFKRYIENWLLRKEIVKNNNNKIYLLFD